MVMGILLSNILVGKGIVGLSKIPNNIDIEIINDIKAKP